MPQGTPCSESYTDTGYWIAKGPKSPGRLQRAVGKGGSQEMLPESARLCMSHSSLLSQGPWGPSEEGIATR